MNRLKELFDKNQEWSERISRQDPDFFPTLAGQQAPDYLWIGCSDQSGTGQRDRRPAAR